LPTITGLIEYNPHVHTYTVLTEITDLFSKTMGQSLTEKTDI